MLVGKIPYKGDKMESNAYSGIFGRIVFINSSHSHQSFFQSRYDIPEQANISECENPETPARPTFGAIIKSTERRKT